MSKKHHGRDAAQPELTVIMPAKGRARFLDEAIASVRQQSFRNWRMLIVHAPSEEDALSVLRRHAKADARIELQPERNPGFVHAINQAVGQVTTPFLMFQESDDISHPQRFALSLKAARAQPHADVVDSWVCSFDSMARAPIGQVSNTHFVGGLYRATSFKRLGILRPFFTSMSDADMLARWKDGGAQFVALPSLLYFKRVHRDASEHLGARGNVSLEWLALCLSREWFRQDKTDPLPQNFTRADVVRLFREMPAHQQRSLLRTMLRYTKKRLVTSPAEGLYAEPASILFANLRSALKQLGASERQVRRTLLRVRIAAFFSLPVRRMRAALRRRRRANLNLPQQTIDAYLTQAPWQVAERAPVRGAPS